MKNPTPITILLPVYNEASGLEEVLKKLINFVRDQFLTYEIIMVDDGSIDESVLIAKKFPEVKLIQNPKNRGYGYALKKGFYAATNDCVITIDADGTYPIEKISDLINEFNNGFDLKFFRWGMSHLHQS